MHEIYFMLIWLALPQFFPPKTLGLHVCWVLWQALPAAL
jgi:hypothetical protein